jgi:hypothetical protein
MEGRKKDKISILFYSFKMTYSVTAAAKVTPAVPNIFNKVEEQPQQQQQAKNEYWQNELDSHGSSQNERT